MFAQSHEQVVSLVKAAHIADGQTLLARRESDEDRIPLAPTCIRIVIAAEPDDTAAPHLGFQSGDLLHKLQELETILPLALIGNSVEKLVNTLLVGGSLVLRHLHLLAQKGSWSYAVAGQAIHRGHASRWHKHAHSSSERP